MNIRYKPSTKWQKKKNTKKEKEEKQNNPSTETDTTTSPVTAALKSPVATDAQEQNGPKTKYNNKRAAKTYKN